MAEEFRSGVNSSELSPGPFIAKIISHLDPSYMGSLEVQILHESGNDDAREGQLRTVKYLNPFYGSTHIDYVSDDPDTHDNTQKAYGMWMVPPDVGTLVVVIFIGGDPRKGFWMGCVQNEDMNFSLPGYAATEYVVDDSRETDTVKTRVPVGEYNKIIHPETQSDTTKKLKPEHPSALALERQGLLQDDIRGITTSSARREVPSMVFGISTPGPVDKTGKIGKVGKHEHKIPNAFVSRLGGSSFVMDDGDDKFLRKTPAGEGPPDYAAVEQDETDGQKDLLHNELIRLRTRTGHQILMHNTEDLIYIGNARGTAWIELTSDGKIEVYAEDSISFRTKQDFNFYADRDINMEAGRNLNTKVHGEMHTHVIGDQILIVDANQKIHIKQAVDITYDTTYTHHVKEDVNILFDANYLHHVKNDVDWVFDTNWKHKVSGQVDWNYQQGLNWDVGGGSGGSATVNSTIFGSEIVRRTGNIDYTVVGNRKITTTGNLDISTGGYNNFTAGASTSIKSAGTHKETASQIHMNSSGNAADTAASAATPGGADSASNASEAVLPLVLKTHMLADMPAQDAESPVDIELIVRRMPTAEPYPLHENLDPMRFKPAETDRDRDGRYSDSTSDMAEPATVWKEYTTKTDTFAKVAPPDQGEGEG
jgi:hypothetical protein